MRTEHFESNVEEGIDLKNNFRTKTLPNPTSKREPASTKHVDTKFTDPSIIKNTTHVNFNNKYFESLRFIKVNSYPSTCHGEHAIAKYYVDQATSICVQGPSLISIDHNEEMKLDKKNSVFLTVL